MRDMSLKIDSNIDGNIHQRDITVNIYDKSYHATIDSISNDGIFIAFRRSSRLLAGKTIDLLMQCEDQQTVRAAKIVWSDEWGFAAQFV